MGHVGGSPHPLRRIPLLFSMGYSATWVLYVQRAFSFLATNLRSRRTMRGLYAGQADPICVRLGAARSDRLLPTGSAKRSSSQGVRSRSTEPHSKPMTADRWKGSQKGLSSSNEASRSSCRLRERRPGRGGSGIAGRGEIGAPVSSACAMSRSSSPTCVKMSRSTVSCASHVSRSSARFTR